MNECRVSDDLKNEMNEMNENSVDLSLSYITSWHILPRIEKSRGFC